MVDRHLTLKISPSLEAGEVSVGRAVFDLKRSFVDLIIDGVAASAID